jgi:hypothetical protein
VEKIYLFSHLESQSSVNERRYFRGTVAPYPSNKMTMQTLPHGNIQLFCVNGSCMIRPFESTVPTQGSKSIVEIIEWANPRDNCQYQSYQYQTDQRLPLFLASSAWSGHEGESEASLSLSALWKQTTKSTLHK